MRITKDTPVDELLHGENIAYIDLDEGELMHWKYIKKKKLPNGKWRYYYDVDSLKKDVRSAFDDVTKKTVKMVDTGKSRLRKYVKTTAQAIKSASDKISTDTNKFLGSVKKRVHKYIAKVPTDGDTYRYFYSDKAYQSYLKGKKAADRILDKNLNTTPSDTAKANAKNFTFNALFSGFGKAVYNLVAPALVALQVELTTPKSFSDLKKVDKPQTNDEHQLSINPDYGKNQTYDNRMNCSFCTAAYDLRKRGYDVEANPISQVEAYTVHDVASWYDGAKVVSQSTVESFFRQRALENPKEALTEKEMLMTALKSNGEGARGHLALYWITGGGHDVIWEIENGEVIIRDCQTGEISRTLSQLDCASGYDYVRTDNVEPNENVLRTVRNKRKR